MQRALESWQPRFLEWWHELGPTMFETNDIYLRTAVAVGQEGWANFGYVKMPDYRWGIFLADAEPDRRIAFGEHKGDPVWQEVPGEYRTDLRRLVVVQGDTEPASVEQQRVLGLTRAEPLRPAEPVPGERRGGPPSLGDGVPPARVLRSRRSRRGREHAGPPLRRPRQAAHPRRVQRADSRLAVVLLLHVLHGPRRQVPARVVPRERVRPVVAHVRIHAQGRGAPHVRRRERHRTRRAAHRRPDGRARHRGRPPARRGRPRHAPEVPELPLLGVARPVRKRDVDQRRELLHERAQGPVPGGAPRRRPPPPRRHVSRHRAA